MIKSKYKFNLDINKDLFRWKVDAYPAFLYPFYQSMILTKYGWPLSEVLFVGHSCFWFNNWEDIFLTGNRIIDDKVIKEKGLIKDFIPEYYQELKQAFLDIDKTIQKGEEINFNTLTEDKIIKWGDKIIEDLKSFWMVVIIPEVLAYTLSHKLKKELKNKNVKDEDISQLVIFPERSFLAEEELHLIKIALEKNKKKREDLLIKHSKNFIWLLNGYHGTSNLNYNYFLKRLEKLRKDKKLKDKYINLKNYSKNINNNFNKLVKKYNLSDRIISLARLTQKSSYFQDKRKAKVSEIIGFISALYKKLSKETSIPYSDLLFLIWPEIRRKYYHRHDIRKIIKKREKSCELKVVRNKEVVVRSKKIGNKLKILTDVYSHFDDDTIKGLVAYQGKVRGKVKIIKSIKNLNKFPRGYVLVTMMTSPDYIIAMKKASAIVTDDGGLTCHASITARELKIPCIVGTKNATSILKDNDLIEVDAYTGRVKLLK